MSSDYEKRFPRWVSLVLGLLQLIITLAIIGLEFGSIYVDLVHGTIWIGFWAGAIFFWTSLMMLCCISCCCRGRCCGSYTMIMQIFCICLACVIIYFDQYFMKNLCQCYLTNTICCAVRGIPEFSSNYQSIVQNCTTVSTSGSISFASTTCQVTPTSKTVYLQAQLGVAVGMIVVSALYILCFIFALCGICFKPKDVAPKSK